MEESRNWKKRDPEGSLFVFMETFPPSNLTERIRRVRAIGGARPEGAQMASKRGMSLVRGAPSCFERKEGVWVWGIRSSLLLEFSLPVPNILGLLSITDTDGIFPLQLRPFGVRWPHNRSQAKLNLLSAGVSSYASSLVEFPY